MIMFRLGDYVGANQEDPQFGRVVELTSFGQILIKASDGTLTGPWSQDQIWPDISAHVDYPHHPGTLYDCPACEAMGTLEED